MEDLIDDWNLVKDKWSDPKKIPKIEISEFNNAICALQNINLTQLKNLGSGDNLNNHPLKTFQFTFVPPRREIAAIQSFYRNHERNEIRREFQVSKM
jgi:hypothetical protein